MSNDNVNQVPVGVVDITANPASRFEAETNDELRREIRLMQQVIHEREIGLYMGRKKAEMDLYSNDNASRVGCTVVVHIDEKKWSLVVYAPGYVPVGSEGIISTYAPRKHGSAGMALDALVERGFDWRWATARMSLLERAYEAQFAPPASAGLSGFEKSNQVFQAISDAGFGIEPIKQAREKPPQSPR